MACSLKAAPREFANNNSDFVRVHNIKLDKGCIEQPDDEWLPIRLQLMPKRPTEGRCVYFC
jgi:hypothetical protein